MQELIISGNIILFNINTISGKIKHITNITANNLSLIKNLIKATKPIIITPMIIGVIR